MTTWTPPQRSPRTWRQRAELVVFAVLTGAIAGAGVALWVLR